MESTSSGRVTARYHWMFGLFFLLASQVQAEEQQVEEIIVTGSYIQGTPEDAALPVDVINREDLRELGDPTLIEMTRNLSYTSGNFGEANLGGGEFANINLRGLGFRRTRILLNGHRYTLDINTIPRSAIQRVEVLKDGASVLYGSDAMAGVVNFITRSRFEGLELRASAQHIDGSDGDFNVGGIFGLNRGPVHWSVSADWERRGALRTSDRDWALLPQADNPQGGWSFMGNPGTYLPALPFGSNPIVGVVPDPQCDKLGSTTVGISCQFQYTYFFNLIQETEHAKVFSELDVDLSDNLTFHAEALYSEVELPEALVSPSFPPTVRVSPDRYVDPTHPGLMDFKDQNPGVFPDVGPCDGVGPCFPGSSQGVFPLTRALGVTGVAGEAGKNQLKTETRRLVAGVNGTLFDGAVEFDTTIGYSAEKFRDTVEGDTRTERMAFAVDGLGGPDCIPSQGAPGVGPCQYFNPFSNAIAQSAVNGATNPQFNDEVANSEELLDWLITGFWTETRFESTFVDAVFSGQTQLTLPGGNIAWAAGGQLRRLEIETRSHDSINRALNPCPFTDPYSIVLGNTDTLDCTAETGLFSFAAVSDEESTRQDVWAVFGELTLPVTDRLDVQAALRYEKYDGNTGSTTDPKLAFSWRTTDWLSFRGSASTTFAGPQLRWLVGTDTQLQLIAVQPGAPSIPIAVDVNGNPDLEPETALATNLGFIVQTGNFYGSVDWWRLDVEDPFYTASGNQIMRAYIAEDCADGGSGVGSPECDVLRSHIVPAGSQPQDVERIVVNRVNGTWELTQGFDVSARYDFYDVAGGQLSVGVEGTYTQKYESGDFVEINGLTVAPGGEFAGYLNEGSPFLPKPKLKGYAFTRYIRGVHFLGLTVRYIDDYKDTQPSLPELAKIDEMVTLDLTYGLELFNSLDLSLSVFNLTDEDPPLVSTDMNYDALTHAGFGRMIKLGLVYRFEL